MHFKTILFLCPIFLFGEVGYVEPWGKDAHLDSKIEQNAPPRKISLMGRGAEQAISFHHNVLTHICGPRSSYRPSSSHYMLDAIRHYGFVKGYLMGCDRLLRENGEPWHYRIRKMEGKYFKWDPVVSP